MKKPRKTKEKAPKIQYKIVQSTQKQIPIKDFANGVIIRNDKKMVKLIEVTPIPFKTLKTNQKNDIRLGFERFLKNAPSSFQIKCVSTPADLTKQINDMETNIQNETVDECIELSREYQKNLQKAQKNNVERKFYIALSPDENTRKTRADDISTQIYKLNSLASSLSASLRTCGNGAKPLNNNETANVLYCLLNRNAYKDIPFEDRYEKVYQKYKDALNEPEDIYVPPTEYLAPKTLYFNNKNYVMCDGRYYYYLYIANDGFPATVYPGWLDIFINTYEGVDVDIYFRKKDSRTLKDELKKTVGHSDSDLSSSKSDMTDSFANASSKYESARYLYRCIMEGQNIYDVSVMVTISGQSVDELINKADAILDQARAFDIKIRNLPYQNEQAFISTLPLDMISKDIEKKAKRAMPQETASCFYPFTTFQLIHDNGIMIAEGQGNTPVIPDFWNTKFVSNSLIFMCGMAGAGKTSFLEYIACHGRAMNTPVFIVAPEKQDDYRRLCYALGGQYVDIGTGSPYRINILDILENDKNVVEKSETIFGNGSNKTQSHLESRVGTVFEFLHTNYPEMSKREEGVLKECINETYARKGITKDNDSLWADEERTHYKEMPILSDLLEVIKEKGNEYETLYYSVKTLTEGAGAHFNGQTNIDVKNKFFVIGTENNTKETKTLSSFLAEDFCQMKIREDRITKTIYIIDEGWAMLNNRFTAEKMYEDSKILRGYMCMFIFATQQMADVLSTDNGAAILKNAETRIIMKHKDEDIAYVSNYIDLSDSEKRMIRGFNVGEALMLANQVRIPIYCNPSSFEQLLTWNDPKTLQRYEEYITEKRKRQEEEQKLKEAREAGKSYGDMIDNQFENTSNFIDTSSLVNMMYNDKTFISTEELEVWLNQQTEAE